MEQPIIDKLSPKRCLCLDSIVSETKFILDFKNKQTFIYLKRLERLFTYPANNTWLNVNWESTMYSRIIYEYMI